MSGRQPEQDELRILRDLDDDPVVERVQDTWARRLTTKRPLCAVPGQLAHHAAAIVADDLGLVQVAFWQRTYDSYVVLGAHGLNPAARRRPVPTSDPALRDLDTGGFVHWDATRFDPPRSTWFPGNTTRDLVVVSIAGDGPVDLATLAGDAVTDEAADAVRAFVLEVDWDV